MKLKKKIAFLTCVSFAAIAISAPIALGKHHKIRGWDYPWDPSTYYQPSPVLDAADTANPSFFMRDLAGQGGSVFDLERLIQSGYVLVKQGDIFGKLSEIFTTVLNDMIPIQNNRNIYIRNLNDKNAYMGNAFRSSIPSDNVFMSHNSSANIAGQTAESQLTYADSVYTSAMQNAKYSMELSNENRAIADDALNALSDPNISTQATQQSMAVLDACIENERARQTELMANISAVKATQRQKEEQNEIMNRNRHESFYFVETHDPWKNPSKSDKEQGLGFVQFK